MSVRAENPLRLMLLPIVPPSAAPRVRPGVLRMALWNEVAPCDCINALLMMTTDWGMSRISPPNRLIDAGGGAKSSLGRALVTVTGVIVVAGTVGSADGTGWACAVTRSEVVPGVC